MLTAFLVLSLATLISAAPQPRKQFHEHFEDFQDLIQKESGEKLKEILSVYMQNEEFTITLKFILTDDFKMLVYEVESLPEFIQILVFLEKNNVDVLYLLNHFDLFSEPKIKSSNYKAKQRQEISGKNVNSFVADVISALPTEKLYNLFQQKISGDEEYKETFKVFNSEEWNDLLAAIWDNECFMKAVDTLNQYGIDVNMLLLQISAIFGLAELN